MVLQQSRISSLELFLGDDFHGLELVEAHDYKVTYRVHKTPDTKLYDFFEALEGNKVNLKISEYSVSQTTLEQIFNGFTAQQEEEQRTLRGVVTL